MHVDLFLGISWLVKRRIITRELGDAGIVQLNGH